MKDSMNSVYDSMYKQNNRYMELYELMYKYQVGVENNVNHGFRNIFIPSNQKQLKR